MVIEPRRALTGRRVNYYTPTKERKTDVVLSQVLEGRVIQTLSILKGKNRGTAYIYMYMCVCINIYIYIYILQEYTARKVVRIAQSEIHQATKAGPNQGFKSWRGELVLDFFNFFNHFFSFHFIQCICWFSYFILQ